MTSQTKVELTQPFILYAIYEMSLFPYYETLEVPVGQNKYAISSTPRQSRIRTNNCNGDTHH